MGQRSKSLAAGEAKLHDIHTPLPRKHWHDRARGLCQVWRSVVAQQVGVLPCGGCQCEGDASGEQELWGAFPALQASLGGKSSRGAQAPREAKGPEHREAEAGAGGALGTGPWRDGTPDPTGNRAGLPGASQKSFPHAASVPRRKISPALSCFVTERPPPHLLYSAVRGQDAPPLPPGPGGSQTAGDGAEAAAGFIFPSDPV